MNKFPANLKLYRKSKRMTLEELAEDINHRYGTKLAKGTISRWENGTDTNMETISMLADYFGLSLNAMLGITSTDGSREVDKFIPIVGTISAGEPLFADQNILGVAACPPFKTSINRSLFYLRVQGDSMNKEFDDGSHVLVDRDAEVMSGDIAVVLINGDEATVKKIKFEDNVIVLIPLSNNYDHYAQKYNMLVTEVTIIGKVIGAFKSY